MKQEDFVGDLIEVYKIFHGLDDIKPDDLFSLETGITRNHGYKIQKVFNDHEFRKYSFSQRIINEWNRLPSEAVNAKSVNIFKNKVDTHLRYRQWAYKSQRTVGSLPFRSAP